MIAPFIIFALAATQPSSQSGLQVVQSAHVESERWHCTLESENQRKIDFYAIWSADGPVSNHKFIPLAGSSWPLSEFSAEGKVHGTMMPRNIKLGGYFNPSDKAFGTFVFMYKIQKFDPDNAVITYTTMLESGGIMYDIPCVRLGPEINFRDANGKTGAQ
jgi:hypothetical protein